MRSLAILVCCLLLPVEVVVAEPPYPLSPLIEKVEWAPASSIVRRARGGDNWPTTWGDDDLIYTAYGDGNGFEPKTKKKLSMGLATVNGSPADFVGSNLRSESAEQYGGGASGKKCSGILMVDGVLYMFVRNADNSQVAWSRDRGKTWTWSDWKFESSFGYPTPLNFGKNYAGARDDYVYVYSHDHDSAYKPADGMVLARVPKDRIADRATYEFFVSRDESGKASWTKDVKQRGRVFENPGGCYRSSISYNAALKRYLWCQTIPGGDTRFKGGIAIYDAPEPWGPWTTAYYNEKWDVGPGETSCFPTKWISEDGKTLHLVFSGDDCFSVRQAKLVVKPKRSSSLGRPSEAVAFVSVANSKEMSFPGESWPTAKPADVRMDEAKLGEARKYALGGGGAGYITRHGKLVMSWGDPTRRYDLKSTTKSIGVTALGLAIKDGKLQLDDKAVKHHPSLGVPPGGNKETGWLDQITILHLATQTAGFEKPGGYKKLLFQPGTKWHYSDGGPNWLAECVTLKYKRDLRDVMFERVFTPLGITSNDLSWRNNSYRERTIDGVARREFGSGISANVDAMARIGYLYLRAGKWRDDQIIPSNFVDAARQPVKSVAGLPEQDAKRFGNASDHYGLLWWNNADGTLKNVPRDAYWSWGLYDSLIVVIPSLDIVATRAGKSWKRDWQGHYDVLRGFLEAIAASAR